MGKPYEFDSIYLLEKISLYFSGSHVMVSFAAFPLRELLWGARRLWSSSVVRPKGPLEKVARPRQRDVSTSAGPMSLRISFPVCSFFFVCHVLQEKVNILFQGFAADHD